MFWEFFIATNQDIQEIEDIFLFVEDEKQIMQISDINLLKNTEFIAKIDENKI